MMKKLALSVLVVAAFVAYSYHQRHDGDANKVGQSTSLSMATGGGTSTSTTQGGSMMPMQGQYKDGDYTGTVEDAFYGNLQVRAVIRMGRIVTVTFLQYPNDRDTSREINGQAMPLLRQEAVQAQSAHVDVVSGATDTSMAFVQSLTAALANAH